MINQQERVVYGIKGMDRFAHHLGILKHQYYEKANEVAMEQWQDLIEEVRMFMDDQQPNVLYSFSKCDGIIAGKGNSFVIDFYPPTSTFAQRIMKLRNQIILAMSNVECGSALYNLLDSLYIIVLYALYDDTSSYELKDWRSEHELHMNHEVNQGTIDDMVQSVLEEILI